MNDVLMFADMLVEGDLGSDLLWFDTAKLVGVFLVDKLDGDDGAGFVGWASFADESVGTGTDCSRDDAEREMAGEGLGLNLAKEQGRQIQKAAHGLVTQ